MHALLNLFDCANCGGERGTLVARIELVEQLPVFADQRNFGGRGARVDAEENLALVALEVAGLDRVAGVARFKFAIVFFVFEERGQSLHLVVHGDTLLETLNQIVDVHARFLFGTHRGADGREEMGIIRVDDVLVRESQGADEGIL